MKRWEIQFEFAVGCTSFFFTLRMMDKAHRIVEHRSMMQMNTALPFVKTALPYVNKVVPQFHSVQVFRL